MPDFVIAMLWVAMVFAPVILAWHAVGGLFPVTDDVDYRELEEA